MVVIDPEWLDTRDRHGRRRLDSPHDFVRIEIESALRNRIRILPVLVEGAVMPRSDELPGTISAMANRQAAEISPTRFHYDAKQLIDAIERIGERHGRGQRQSKPPALLDLPSLLPVHAAPASLPAGFRLAYELTSRAIHAPVQVVWDILVDVSRFPDLVPLTHRVEPLTPGPVRKGYRWREHGKLLLTLGHCECEYTVFEPPHRLEVSQQETNGQVSYITRTELMFDSVTTMHVRCHNEPSTLGIDNLLGKRLARTRLGNIAAAAEATYAR